MRKRRVSWPLLVCCAGWVTAHPAAAQLRPGEPLRLPAADQNLTSGATSESVAVNPANLAFLPGSELRLSSVYLDDAGSETTQGHALTFGMQIPVVKLGTALRLDLIDPPSDAARRSFGASANYQWLTWGLAYRVSTGLALGASVSGSWSSSDAFDGLGALAVGLTSRPSDVLSIALSAHDLNGSRTRDALGVRPSYHAALGLRPWGTSSAELELGTAYIDAPDGYFIPRAGFGVEVPGFGRVSGEVAVSDPTEEHGERSWLAKLMLAVRLNGTDVSAELAGGALAGNALGEGSRSRAHENVVTSVALRGFREPAAVSASAYALRISLENGPSPRSHFALLRRLWAIAEHDDQAKAVVLRVRAAPAGSLAHIDELRDALQLLRQRGKKVLCQLEDTGGATLYLCSAADRIVLTPAGRVRFAGFSARYLFIPKLLEHLGIRAEYARIGAHKSAPEMFSHERSSDVARDDHIDLLQQFERHMVQGLARDRRIPALELRKRIAQGPYLASEARRVGLIDDLTHEDGMEALVASVVGRELPLRDDSAPFAPERHGLGKGIAVIYVDGDMVDGRSRNIPLLGIKLVGSYTVADAIRRARDNPKIGAIVVRLETGGGSALAADVIWRQLSLAAERKPVLASIGSIGASAGYYVASAGSRVYASPLTITGSIGVFAGKVDGSELLRKLGISLETYKTAPRADADSLFRALTADEQRELERKVGQFYDLFLDRVSAGRTRAGAALSKQQVDAAGQGRVWTGEQALARGLVDELGGFRQALAEARRLAGLSDDAPIVELPDVTGNFFQRMVGLASSPSPTLAGFSSLQALARALGPVLVHADNWPLMRMEFVPVE